MLSRRVPADRAPNPLAALLAERRAAAAALLDLTESNPTRVGLSGAGVDALGALAHPAAATYRPEPLGLPAARRAVADLYAERRVEVSPEDVVLTASTSEAYAHLFRLLCDPGDEVLAPAPSYPLFEPLAVLEGVQLRQYRLRHDHGWQLDVDSLERAVGPRSRAVIVVQPNNPTGSCLDAVEQSALEDFCLRHRITLIADEVFGDFPHPPATAPLPTLAGRERVPTFVLSGLSKSCGMPQLKLAWIVLTGPEGARREAREGLEWIADLFLSVSTPVQIALPHLLEARHAFQWKVRERLSANLAALARASSGGSGVEALPADGGWSAVLRMPRTRTDEEWAMELLRRDVVVHPGHFYDFDGEGFLVVSLLAEPEVFAEGVKRIAALGAEG